MKKIITLLLVILMIVPSVIMLTQCTSKPDEAEVMAAFKELYEKSVKINEYVFGKGLPVDGDFDKDDIKSPYYVAVSADAEYKSMQELEAAVLEVYSSGYYEDALKGALFDGFEGVSDVKPKYTTDGGIFKVDAAGKAADTSGRFDVESARIVKLSAGFASIKATYTRGSTVAEYTLTMALTEQGWRFDAPTY